MKYPKYTDIPHLSATDPESYEFQQNMKKIETDVVKKWGHILDFSKPSKSVKCMLIEPQERWIYKEL